MWNAPLRRIVIYMKKINGEQCNIKMTKCRRKVTVVFTELPFFGTKLLFLTLLFSSCILINDNIMISGSIWKEHVLVSFSKTSCSTRSSRSCYSCYVRQIHSCLFFFNLHLKPHYNPWLNKADTFTSTRTKDVKPFCWVECDQVPVKHVEV